MRNDESILEYCTPEFARSWGHIGTAEPLFAGFIDAMALVAFARNGEAHVLLEGPGFTKLFGEGEDGEANFILRAERQDRDNLLSACRMCQMRGPALHADVGWNAGQGLHAGEDDNYFKTVTAVEHVGHIDDQKLLYFAIRDVSARRTAEHTLSRSRFQSALRALFDEIFLLSLDTGSNEPIYAGGRPLVKEDGTPIDCGFHSIYMSVHPDDIRLFWKYSNYTFVEKQLFGDEPKDAITFDLRRRDEVGEYHWTRIYISRIAAADKRKNVLVCSQNIDEQKDAQRRERELRSKAQIDALTGVYNHGTSEEVIRAKLDGLEAGESAVFCIVDVDDFKRVNDTYGHSMGDSLLKVVAESVRGICREDDIVGRMGGDEFVALFCSDSMPDEDGLRARLERCKELVSGQSASLGINPPVTLSIGVVAATVGDNAYNEIFDRADRLLYHVKRSGKNSLCFE